MQIFLQQKDHVFNHPFQTRGGLGFLFINHLRLIIGKENVWYCTLPGVDFSSSRLHHDAFIQQNWQVFCFYVVAIGIFSGRRKFMYVLFAGGRKKNHLYLTLNRTSLH